MKKIWKMMMLAASLTAVWGCVSEASSEDDRIQLEFIIPKEAEEGYYYSSLQISPKSDTVKLESEEGSPDAEIILVPVSASEGTEYLPSSITAGIPVEYRAEKGQWFRVAVKTGNTSDEEVRMHIRIEKASVREDE